MITDMNNTGVPSATRGRMQLAKPVQTANSGLSQPTTNAPMRHDNPMASAPNVNVAQNQLGSRYNPFEPKNQTTIENTTEFPETAQGIIPKAQAYSNANSVNGMNNAPKTSYTADEAAGIIALMDESSLVDLLNRISDGSVKPRSGQQATPGQLTGVGNSQIGGNI